MVLKPRFALAVAVLRALSGTAVPARGETVGCIIEMHLPVAARAAIVAYAGLFANVVDRH